MGGEIKLNEKEKWAAYFSEVLRVAGYSDAAKHLHVMAYGRHRPIDDFPVGLTTANKDYVKIVNAILEAQKEVQSLPKKTITKKPFKPTLQEDIHGDKGEE